MRLRSLVRKLKMRWLAGLIGGAAFACSGRPVNPSEAPPMAPRPDPMQPAPGQPNPKRPVPGSPDPLPAPPDGAPVTRDLPAPQFQSSGDTPADAGADAVVLPPDIPDALPSDANKQPESVSFKCC